METRILNYFLAIARLGTISGAARELHVAQPTLSRQLKQLEDQLGTPLFYRERRRMVLTKAGAVYRSRVEQILGELNQANRVVAEINNADLVGQVRLGCIESRVVSFLVPIMTKFRQQHPHVQFDIYDADGEEIKERLDQGILEIGIVSSPISTAKYHSLRLPVTDRWGLAVPMGSPLAEKTVITADELDNVSLIVPHRSLILDELQTWLHPQNGQLKIVAETNLLSNACYLAAGGMGSVVCIEGAPRPADAKLKFIPLQPEHLQDSFLIWRKNVRLSEPARLLIQTTQSTIDSQNE
jgi:DNA-binding transcriptional LysR family regulator